MNHHTMFASPAGKPGKSLTGKPQTLMMMQTISDFSSTAQKQPAFEINSSSSINYIISPKAGNHDFDHHQNGGSAILIKQKEQVSGMLP